MTKLAAPFLLLALSAHALPVSPGSAAAVTGAAGKNIDTAAGTLLDSQDYPQPYGPRPMETPPGRPAIRPDVDPYQDDSGRLIERRRPAPNPGLPMPPAPGPGFPRGTGGMPFAGSKGLPLDELIGVEGLRRDLEEEGITDDTAYIHKAATPQVIVQIDKSEQTITVWAPETAALEGGRIVRYVSTGGGVKHPVDPQTGAPDQPYCADDVTPDVTDLVIPAVENVPGKSTMFQMKRSNRFESAIGEGVPMPYAIHVVGHGGIYLHQVPPGYEKLLGQNVSGGCIRLDAEMAKWLYEEMKIYGSIQLSIFGETPVQKCMKDANGQIVDLTAKRPRVVARPQPRPAPRESAESENPIGAFFNRLFN